MKKQDKKNAVVVAAKPEVVTPTVEKSDREIVQQINKDMVLGDLGEFCRKRAGVGLCAIRAFHNHGEWEKRLMELFPTRSLRTLNRYVKAGEEVCRRFPCSGCTGSPCATCSPRRRPPTPPPLPPRRRKTRPFCGS